MRRRGCVLLLLAVSLAVAPAGEAGAGNGLPKRCATRFGSDVLALICDPAGGSGAGFAISAEGGTSSGRAGTGVAKLTGDEPFHGGERLSFDLTGGSAGTVAAFEVDTRDGRRQVVVAPFSPAARRYDVAVGAAVAQVTTDDGRARRIRFTPPPPRFSNSTPGAAVRSFVRLIDADHVASFDAACELLSGDAKTALSAYDDCPALLAFVLFDEEVDSYPDLRSMDVRRVRVVHRRPTIARAELVYRFEPEYRGDPGVLREWTTVALTREAGGWRIAQPGWFSPTYVVSGRPAPTVRQVRRRLDILHRGALEVRARERHRQEATRGLLPAATACPAPVRTAVDAPRDVTYTEDGGLARHQDASGVDLIGASQSHVGRRVCFELRFRTPLAARASLDLWLTQRFPIRGHPLWADGVRIDIEGDRAVAFRDVAAADRLGPPFFPVDVKVSAARDALSIDIRDSRGWPAIDPAKPNRFAAEAWSPLATGEVYFDELQP